ncbi:MAG: hypothetical protein CM1200mP18_12820 [Gammaproteobacteria bacterium]|nr:MAG: hypothetical protein CM1200mP18_12820 [Gammaproteobacteria bacterium]
MGLLAKVDPPLVPPTSRKLLCFQPSRGACDTLFKGDARSAAPGPHAYVHVKHLLLFSSVAPECSGTPAFRLSLKGWLGLQEHAPVRSRSGRALGRSGCNLSPARDY